MNLYTIIVGFEDHCIGIGQHTASSPIAALREFVCRSESLEGYDRKKLLELIREEYLMHAAGGMLGLWSWYPGDGEDESLGEILGGHIIQTDPNGPLNERK